MEHITESSSPAVPGDEVVKFTSDSGCYHGVDVLESGLCFGKHHRAVASLYTQSQLDAAIESAVRKEKAENARLTEERDTLRVSVQNQERRIDGVHAENARLTAQVQAMRPVIAYALAATPDAEVCRAYCASLPEEPSV